MGVWKGCGRGVEGVTGSKRVYHRVAKTGGVEGGVEGVIYSCRSTSYLILSNLLGVIGSHRYDDEGEAAPDRPGWQREA